MMVMNHYYLMIISEGKAEHVFKSDCLIVWLSCRFGKIDCQIFFFPQSIKVRFVLNHDFSSYFTLAILNMFVDALIRFFAEC